MTNVLVSMTIVLMWIHPAAGDERSADPVPEFSCNLTALSEEDVDLYEKLSYSLVAAVQETVELQDGYAFRLPRETLVTAAQWVSFESRCCPFFAFEIALADDGGPLWLRMTGADGVKAFIRAEFAAVVPTQDQDQ